MFRYLAGLGTVSALLAGAAILAPQAPAFSAPTAAGNAAAVSAQAESYPAPQVRAGAYRLDKGHAKILWSVSHFGFSEYTGEFTDFDAQLTLDPAHPAASRLAVTVATPSVATHNDALDRHLKNADFFDVAKHPTASFSSTAVRRTGANTADVTGTFTLLGRSHPLTLAVTFNKAGENMGGVYTAGFSATGTIKRSDYGMTYAVPGVSDEVQLRISGEFNPAT